MTTPIDPINRIVYLIALQDINGAQNNIVELAMVHGYRFTDDDVNRIMAAAESQAPPDAYMSIRDTLSANSELKIY